MRLMLWDDAARFQRFLNHGSSGNPSQVLDQIFHLPLVRPTQLLFLCLESREYLSPVLYIYLREQFAKLPHALDLIRDAENGKYLGTTLPGQKIVPHFFTACSWLRGHST